MKFTPLYEQHVLGAGEVINLKEFARAMHYRGHLAEHRATREGVTLCDVSHMGEIDIQGPEAIALVQKLITNDAARLSINQALYSVMCNGDGGIIDDLLCYRLAEDHFVWVVNVTKTDEDHQWMLQHAQGLDVKIRNVSTDTALLALQGPLSREVLQRITKADLSTLRYYRFAQTTIYTRHAEVPCLVSRTGYTGEHGYEIMVARDFASWVWDELIMVGQPLGILAHGVAARESLRTEAGYLLNGNDMDSQTNPFEAGLGWTVKFTKDFIGAAALAKIRASGVSRKLVGLEVDGSRTVRHGYRIYKEGREIGQVTSGPLPSKLAGRNLGLAYVGAEYSATGTPLEVDIRGDRCKAHVVPMPFCPRRAKEEPAIRTYSPYDLRFSASHMWARLDDERGDVITLGVSDYGQRSLGDVMWINLPKVGQQVREGSFVGHGDTYRRFFELISPVTGEVVAINETLATEPGQINAYPYACAGVLKLRVTSPAEYDRLMQFGQYAELVRRLQRYEEWTKDRRVT